MFKKCIQRFTEDRNYAIASTLVAVVIAVSILGLFLAAKVVSEVKGWSQDQYAVNSITVQGEGEVLSVPDVAMFTFSVNATAESVEAAQQQSATAMNAALAYLKEQGVEEKDIKTTSYYVNPHYSNPNCIYGPRGEYNCPEAVITGYDVSQSIEVRVRDTAKSGEILTGIGSRGVNNVSGLQFIIDDESNVKEEARSMAIADAKEKAEKLAKDLGVSLKRITSFYEESGYYPMYDGYGGAEMKAMSAVAPNTPVGENSVTSRVNITYEIR